MLYNLFVETVKLGLLRNLLILRLVHADYPKQVTGRISSGDGANSAFAWWVMDWNHSSHRRICSV